MPPGLCPTGEEANGGPVASESRSVPTLCDSIDYTVHGIL